MLKDSLSNIEDNNRWVRKEEERERTGSHVSDTGCIPLGEITVERKGIEKRYTKETKRYTEIERK